VPDTEIRNEEGGKKLGMRSEELGIGEEDDV